jgi:hypothetical protein
LFTGFFAEGFFAEGFFVTTFLAGDFFTDFLAALFFVNFADLPAAFLVGFFADLLADFFAVEGFFATGDFLDADLLDMAYSPEMCRHTLYILRAQATPEKPKTQRFATTET